MPTPSSPHPRLLWPPAVAPLAAGGPLPRSASTGCGRGPRRRLVLASALLPALAAAGSLCGAETPPFRLRLVERFAAPPGASDLRWAPDLPRAVVLSEIDAGVAVRELAPELPVLRQLLPKAAEIRRRGYRQLAVSGGQLAVADRDSEYGFVLRPYRGPWAKVRFFDLALTAAFDLRGETLLLVGAGDGSPDATGMYDPSGTLAWVGSVKALGRLTPLLGGAGPGAPLLARCLDTEAAAARILSDGRLLVAPLGAEAGAYLYTPEGRLLRRWSWGELGVDDPCAGVGFELLRSADRREPWRNARRLIEGALEIDGRPALLVRGVSGGVARWTLKLLEGDGAVVSLPLPFEGVAGERLRVDVRPSGRPHVDSLVLLRRPNLLTGRTRSLSGEVLVLEVEWTGGLSGRRR